jgi:carbon monoxide dehydrogenase subunit G
VARDVLFTPSGDPMPTTLEPFAGQEQFAAAPARVFAAITDPESLARAIPDLTSHERVDERTLKGVVRPGFSFMRASMKLVLTIDQASPPAPGTPGRAEMNITSGGIGASMKVGCRILLQEHDGGTRLDWEAEVHELKGLIAAVSPALIRGAADKVIRDGWEAIRREVEPV